MAAGAPAGVPQRGSIWLYALGYFACYVPYAALTKAASSGLLVDGRRLGGVIAIGVLSQGTGVFGALVLVDGRESAFCAPVNRASSVLAGLVSLGPTYQP